MEQIQEIFTDRIKLPKDNMREYIDRDEIFELKDDIVKNGLLSPIIVRPLGADFELVAGQRRFLAHQFGGMIKIKCIVRNLTDEEALSVMTSENLSRVDVNPVDESKHVARLLESTKGDIQQVAKITGRSEKWVKDRLTIREMPDYMQELLAKKELKIGVALRLNEITDESTRKAWTFQAVRDGANVAQAEYWLMDFNRRKLPGGDLAENSGGSADALPPAAVLFRCAIDGQEYDTRLMKSVVVYEGNMEYFFAFVEAFRKPAD